jgi:hypothetical protein
MNDVNLEALAGRSTNLQSHRGGTGEIRYTSVDVVDGNGRPATAVPAGGTLVVRAAYRAQRAVERPLFQLAIIDVDSGLVVTTASSAVESTDVVNGDGAVECRFANVPLRPRQYVLRLSISDRHHLASYDVVTAGPRFAVVGQGQGVDSLADQDDGLVSVPFEFRHTHGVAATSPS